MQHGTSQHIYSLYYGLKARAEERLKARLCHADESPILPPASIDPLRQDPLRKRSDEISQNLRKAGLGNLAGCTLLEIGVGNGSFAVEAACSGVAKLILVDISPERLVAASKHVTSRGSAPPRLSVLMQMIWTASRRNLFMFLWPWK